MHHQIQPPHRLHRRLPLIPLHKLPAFDRVGHVKNNVSRIDAGLARNQNDKTFLRKVMIVTQHFADA